MSETLKAYRNLIGRRLWKVSRFEDRSSNGILATTKTCKFLLGRQYERSYENLSAPGSLEPAQKRHWEFYPNRPGVEGADSRRRSGNGTLRRSYYRTERRWLHSGNGHRFDVGGYTGCLDSRGQPGYGHCSQCKDE